MDGLDYKKFYSLQDEVLYVVFNTENEFYLTGGTCLSRFYIEKRLSDDLDFFTNHSPRYSFAVRRIKQGLINRFNIVPEVESRDFTRYKVNGLLQVDFVNDVEFRYKDVIITQEKYIIDNVENILSNKITAVIGRDNPKDVFDIYLIWKFYDFSWKDILEASLKKSVFSKAELLVRLKSFPKKLFEKIKITDEKFLDNFDSDFEKIIYEINNL